MITLASDKQTHYANEHRKPAPAYKVGDFVWLNTKNIATARRIKKFDYKNIYCKVLAQLKDNTYRLKLLLRIEGTYNIFHANLLRLDPNDPLLEQVQPPEPTIIVPAENENNEDHEE